MKAETVEARLQVNRVGGRDPDRRTIAGLSPHAQRRDTFIRVRQTQNADDSREQLLAPRLALKLTFRKPGTYGLILQAAARCRWQYNERGSIVI